MITAMQYNEAWRTLRTEVAAAGDDKEKAWQAFQKYEGAIIHPVLFTLNQLSTIINNP